MSFLSGNVWSPPKAHSDKVSGSVSLAHFILTIRVTQKELFRVGFEVEFESCQGVSFKQFIFWVK